MTTASILRELRHVRGPFPRAAVQAAIADPAAITPYLLDALRDTPTTVAAREDSYFLHLYACYLLAQFRCAEALPLIVKFFDAADESAMDVTGDFVGQDLGRVLASLCLGRPEVIFGMVENPDLNQWTRAAAISACVALYVSGELTQDDLIAYFSALFAGRLTPEPGYWWNALVAACGTVRATSLMPAVEQAFVKGLVETDLITLADVQADMDTELASGQLVHFALFYTLIDDTIAELEPWDCFREPEPVARRPVPPSSAKVGRNDPCPCGSGRKFKKCCLNKPVAPPVVDDFPWDRQTASLDDSTCPELDALFARGFDLACDGNDEEACRVLGRAWGQIRTKLTPAMKSLQDIGPAYGGVFYPADNVDEYIRATENAARSRPGAALAGIDFCEFVLAQFTDESDHSRGRIRASLGTLHFLAGDPVQGEKTLRALIADQPRQAIGYAYLSGALTCESYLWRNGGPLDRAQAIVLLREALALPVEDAEDFDLEYRLQDLE